MTSISETFKDKLPKYNHLEHIRKKLLSEEGKSKVSVMVGSGFSLNADKIDESLDGMSTWSELKDKLMEGLEVEGDPKNNIDVLNLSQKYAEEYGRYSLEELIKRSVPDQNYEPGEIHRELLNLPWTDVYTTNYDTLLERTLPSIFERNYQVVYEPRDISNSVAPRIIKLHGSFPSNRPFIFTEKDYEDYNRTHAPLVNMVQQSIMETTFVLIGFSGDDPNFQAWTKWVHENLGEHMPNIYMIGYNESEKENDIEQQGIKVIDFKKVYEEESLTDPYKKLFKDLFNFLGTSNERVSKDWPYKNYEVLNKELGEATQIFFNNRKDYPGWMILPDIIRKSNIEKVQRGCKNLEHLIKESKEGIEKKTEALYELLWVYDLFQLPLTVSLHELMKQTVNESLYGFYLLDDLSYIILRLIKEARLDFNEAEFKQYVDLLKECSLKQKYIHQLKYEKILFKLIKFEFSRAKDLVDEWVVEDNEIEWKVKKAIVLLSLDEKEEAKLLFETSLNTVRKILSRNKNNNYRFLSMEGILLSNLRRLNESSDYNRKDRLSILEYDFCNPLKELSLMYSRISPYERKTGQFISKGFDPDRITYTSKFQNIIEPELIESYSLIMLYEEWGLKLSYSSSVKSTINTALNNFESLYPFYSWITFLQIGNKKWIDDFFSRKIVYRANKESLTKISSIAINAIENKRNTILMLEILSRLYFALLKEEKQLADKVVLKLYANEKFHNDNVIKVKSIFEPLFSRILFDKYGSQKEKFIEKIYESPIVGDSDGVLSEVKYDNSFYFDPTFVFNLAEFDSINLNVNPAEINRLMSLLDSEKPIRDAALRRLLYLLETGNLAEDTERNLRSKIAEFIKLKGNMSDRLLKSYLVQLTNDYALQKDLCDDFVKKSIPESYYNGGVTIDRSMENYLKDLKNIFPNMLNKKTYFLSITPLTYEEWLKRFFEWWENQKEWLLNKDGNLSFGEEKDDLLQIVIFLKNYFLPNIPIQSLSKSDIDAFYNIFIKLKESRLDIAIFLIPGLLRIGAVGNEEIHVVENGLINNDYKIYRSASVAVSELLILNKRGAIDIDLKESKDILLNLYKVRKELSLLEVTIALSDIIRFVPGCLEENEYSMIIRTLNLIYNDLMNNYYHDSSIADQELELMAESTRLAGEISQTYGQNEIPDLIIWKELSQKDRLPEVRQHNHLFIKDQEGSSLT